MLSALFVCPDKMIRVMKKLAFCICENKDADKLCSNCAADQRPICYYPFIGHFQSIKTDVLLNFLKTTNTI